MKRSKRTQEVLVEGKDYVITEEGWWIFTKAYLLNRGFCCFSGCKNCPYEEINIAKRKIDKKD
ncbi:MAG: hypothetical protein ACI8ZX_000855 [Planctomycetota bacterium]|jgi:hypothetical protein